MENEGSRKIVVLIDADNAQVGKLSAIMAEIATHGHIIVKKAYGDWSRQSLMNWKEELNLLAIQPIQQFAYTTGKNSTDIVMVIDAMDLLYTGKYDTFVLVSSDSDFTSLASRLRASEVYVFGIGEKKTPMAFRNACDNFSFTEDMVTLQKQIIKKESDSSEIPINSDDAIITDMIIDPIENIIQLLNKACETFSDDEGWTFVANAGNYIKRSISGFNPMDYGFDKLTQLIKSHNNLYEMKKDQGKGNVIIYKYRKK